MSLDTIKKDDCPQIIMPEEKWNPNDRDFVAEKTSLTDKELDDASDESKAGIVLSNTGRDAAVDEDSASAAGRVLKGEGTEEDIEKVDKVVYDIEKNDDAKEKEKKGN